MHRRVQELDNSLEATSKMNLSLQTIEAELRHNLQGAVLPQEYENVRKKLEDLTNEKVCILVLVMSVTRNGNDYHLITDSFMCM